MFLFTGNTLLMTRYKSFICFPFWIAVLCSLKLRKSVGWILKKRLWNAIITDVNCPRFVFLAMPRNDTCVTQPIKVFTLKDETEEEVGVYTHLYSMLIILIHYICSGGIGIPNASCGRYLCFHTFRCLWFLRWS